MSGSTRWLAGVGAAVLVVVVVGIAAALSGGPAAYPADSPEYAVQQYVQAVADRDTSKALSFMSPELQERCEDFPREAISARGESAVRATLEETTLRDGTAIVRVQITQRYGDDPFGGGESDMPVVFELRQTAEGWRFTEAPWPLYCARPLKDVPR